MEWKKIHSMRLIPSSPTSLLLTTSLVIVSGIACFTIVGTLSALSGNPESQDLPTAIITSGNHSITAELATTYDEHRIGLMHRKELPENHGMLFIYPDADIRCFWMKNTYIPLTVAFLDDSGTILSTVDMIPHTRTPHCSDAPARYGLEMNQGWFYDQNIRVGDTLSLPQYRRP